MKQQAADSNAKAEIVLGPKMLRHRLLAWFDRNKRSMPWRGESDPYRILVSEVMLQQTQVKTVIPYYLRFIERFPTVKALARAPEDQRVPEGDLLLAVQRDRGEEVLPARSMKRPA